MDRKIKTLITILALVFITTGCGAGNSAPAGAEEKTEEASEAQQASDEEDTSAGDTEEISYDSGADQYDDPESLPEFTYQGTEEYMDVISDYLIREEKDMNPTSSPDVYIPFGIIVQVDDTDPDHMIAYGDYGIDGYNLLNTTLVVVTGSRTAGAVFLKKNDDGTVEVTGADLPMTSEESKEIFAPVEGLYEKVTALSNGKMDEAKEEAIAQYVNTNGLNITQWQGSGQKAVPVLNAPDTPEEAQFYTYDSPLGYKMTFDIREFSLTSTGDDDMYGKIEDTWTGTLMVIKKAEGNDADAAIGAVLSEAGADTPECADAMMGGNIACRRAAYDEPLEDGRIFRYVCYAVPTGDGVITVLIETTCEEGVSELSVEELEKTFEGTLATFSV